MVPRELGKRVVFEGGIQCTLNSGPSVLPKAVVWVYTRLIPKVNKSSRSISSFGLGHASRAMIRPWLWQASCLVVENLLYSYSW